jgi:hypothetical protein
MNGLTRQPGLLFWAGAVLVFGIQTAAVGAGDYDGDGIVDLSDYAEFPDCFTGPGEGPSLRGCDAFDADGDTDIDLVDFLAFQRDFLSCAAPGGVLQELYCDERYRGIISHLTPLLLPAVCEAVEAVGQPERCPEAGEGFYVEMKFAAERRAVGTPTLHAELADGGPAVGIRFDAGLCHMEVLLDGVSTTVVSVPFSMGFRTAAVMDALTVVQKTREWIGGLIYANQPCFLWHSLDLQATFFTEEYIFAVTACSEFKTTVHILLIDEECFEEYLDVFVRLTCADLVIDIEDYFTGSQRNAVACASYLARDWICEFVCPCEIALGCGG